MSSPAAVLKDRLLSLSVRVGEIRALSLVDADGLPLVSTLGPGQLDEALAAFGGGILRQLERAQRDFQMGPMYQVHLVGRDRQLFITPVNGDFTLAALVESHATPATITMHLLALVRDLLPHLASIEPLRESAP
ncbi:MAG: roadblock/LC7 domain-containing protein [Acidobacteria bacterium]|nr:roadblock/LC7 domain-containing protein [Acidobacteriota bacterium]